ncbi:hypothetical protein ACOSP7_022885 [Xanthoceras sorbifolium]|uniref:Late embryogenesis abundant protein n=1 Tax=Xanthoceras sorbifolium TaxID=99658 RepID=A0ABQ8HPZ8_9ROSI|nr:hypothetical protein JRO89_XS08G0156200 [Xanthoceras sorbifolium]
MNHAIRSIRTNPPPTVFLSRFRQATTMQQSKRPEKSEGMDKSQNQNKPTEKTGDVMSHSFGEGYATRSDEEGFGGIYGDNQSFPEAEADKKIHENHPDYDKTQGSEVKEKEKARHQTNASS